MIYILTILIKSFLLSFVISKFQTYTLDGLKITRDELIDLLPDSLYKWHLQDAIKDIDTLFNCIKCQSFWVALILSGNVWIACTSYIMAFLYVVWLSRYEQIKLY